MIIRNQTVTLNGEKTGFEAVWYYFKVSYLISEIGIQNMNHLPQSWYNITLKIKLIRIYVI